MNNIYDDNLAKLQAQMKKDGIKAYVIPVTDPHQSEYVAPRYSLERMSLCSFKGSDGTLLVTQDHAYIYTDGRYWIEAMDELKGTNTELVRMGDFNVPSIFEFIKTNHLYPLAMDFANVSYTDFKLYKGVGAGEIIDKSYRDLILPKEELPFSKIWKVEQKLLSTTYEQRIDAVIASLKKQGVEGTLISSLDDIAYLTGWRADDIECTPVFLGYMYIGVDGDVKLFIHAQKTPEVLSNTEIYDYDEVWGFLKTIEDKYVLLDPRRTNEKVVSYFKKGFLLASNPSQLQKSIKGDIEIQNTKEIHELDGLAVLKIWYWVTKHIKENHEKYSEYEIASLVDSYRFENPRCYELSFTTIAAFRGHAAMMHYSPTKEDSSIVDGEGIDPILLIDSGGQYYGGTTDITRTFCLGESSAEYRIDYTLTAKSVLDLANTIFLQGCAGTALDIKARENMWKRGMDYKCGTGHGVGYMLGVHEGPNGFRYRVVPERDDSHMLLPGQIQSDEPGVYKGGKYGIRIESELLTVRKFETPDGLFNGFEWITYCPLDGENIDTSILSDEEIQWFNDYQKLSLDTLTPYVKDDKDLYDFLVEKSKPISRK